MKKIIALTLALSMIFSLGACKLTKAEPAKGAQSTFQTVLNKAKSNFMGLFHNFGKPDPDVELDSLDDLRMESMKVEETTVEATSETKVAVETTKAKPIEDKSPKGYDYGTYGVLFANETASQVAKLLVDTSLLYADYETFSEIVGHLGYSRYFPMSNDGKQYYVSPDGRAFSLSFESGVIKVDFTVRNKAPIPRCNIFLSSAGEGKTQVLRFSEHDKRSSYSVNLSDLQRFLTIACIRYEKNPRIVEVESFPSGSFTVNGKDYFGEMPMFNLPILSSECSAGYMDSFNWAVEKNVPNPIYPEAILIKNGAMYRTGSAFFSFDTPAGALSLRCNGAENVELAVYDITGELLYKTTKLKPAVAGDLKGDTFIVSFLVDKRGDKPDRYDIPLRGDSDKMEFNLAMAMAEVHLGSVYGYGGARLR